MNEEEKTQKLDPASEKFLVSFLTAYSLSQQSISLERSAGVNSAALIFEKIRVAMEYQEEHLVFKNAISRIARRQITLLSGITSEALFHDLIRELSWANYVNPESLDDKKRAEIQKIIDRYLVIVRNLNAGLYPKMDLQKKVIDWMACEIEETIRPKSENLILIDFAAKLFEKNLNLNTKKVPPEENLIMLKMSIYSLLFKPDLGAIEYFLLNQVYPKWPSYSRDEAKKFARSFEPYFNKVNRYIHLPLKGNYLKYVKRNIPPFIVLRSVLTSYNFTSETVAGNITAIEAEADTTYRQLVGSARKKVMRGTLRALFFILITKITLAFIVEVPFDYHFSGKINYFSLAVNVLFPPFLMFIAGTFIKSPPLKNAVVVRNSISSILNDGKIIGKKYDLIKTENKSFALFNFLYGLVNIAILVGVINLLIKIDFNIVSIALFFFFISVVSFFSFRIRNIALELAMERSTDDAIVSSVEFLFLPFIKIGKFISDRLTTFNPMIMMVDFLIEAPLKIIIRIVNSWRGFIRSKKEDMEY